MGLGDEVKSCVANDAGEVQDLIARMSDADIQACLDKTAPAASLGDRLLLATALLIARAVLKEEGTPDEESPELTAIFFEKAKWRIPDA